MSSNCLFCQIVAGEVPARIIHENEQFLAFLTPFPNTDGFTVVATKQHFSSYIFDLPPEIYLDMLVFAKEVGKKLDAALGVQRTGLVFEGMGIDHAHVKLIPLHGIDAGDWKPVKSNRPIFYEQYPGFIASHDGPRQEEARLEAIYQKIISHTKEL